MNADGPYIWAQAVEGSAGASCGCYIEQRSDGARFFQCATHAAAPEMLRHLYRLIAWIPPTPADYGEQGATAFTPEARYLIDAQNAARAILRDLEGTT